MKIILVTLAIAAILLILINLKEIIDLFNKKA